MVARTLAILALVLALRIPFLNQAIQGDDYYYLAAAEHAQIDPAHPQHARYLFLGDMVDMRGFPHPPLNSWVLAALLAALGDVREIPFHAAYILFSLIAALSMWSLARRFCEQPLLATVLFLAVPAFVVNGNSFESDLPFLAFWMAAVALFVRAVDTGSRAALVASAVAGALAGLAAYQAIFLPPVLAVYLIERKRNWAAGWAALLAAPVALTIWQLYERASSGALPASILAGYMQSYGWHRVANKARSAAALVVHAGWLVSPLLVLMAFRRGRKWAVAAAGLAAIAGIFYDPNPLFWASLGCGVLLLAQAAGRDFLRAWIATFVGGAVVVFFAGSARYLLPVAAPVAILAAQAASARVAWTAFALQLTLSLGLAVANYQHWAAYRKFALSVSKEAAERRVWADADWGLRYYLEAEGALPLPKQQVLRPGELVVSSALALPVPVNSPVAVLSSAEVRPAVPLRLISLTGRSAYSTAGGGLLPFEISAAPADRVRAELVLERKAALSYVDPRTPAGTLQAISGIFPDGWMTGRAAVLLKVPEHPVALSVSVFIPPDAPARYVRLMVGDQVIAEEGFPAPGGYTLSAPFTTPVTTSEQSLTVTITVDRTHAVPGDRRELGVVVTGVGFR